MITSLKKIRVQVASLDIEMFVYIFEYMRKFNMVRLSVWFLL